jgi:hypothetical protein
MPQQKKRRLKKQKVIRKRNNPNRLNLASQAKNQPQHTLLNRSKLNSLNQKAAIQTRKDKYGLKDSVG